MKLSKNIQNWIIAGYIFALILLSVISISGGYSPSKRHLIGIRGDYVLHMMFFLPWMTLARMRWNPCNRSRIFWITLWIGFALAAASEFIQLVIPNKSFNPLDLAANGLGVMLGAMISLLIPLGGERRL
jgi:glycopeptide antibiotics resistance protein